MQTTSWLMRGTKRDVEARVLNQRWPLAKDDLPKVIPLMRPGDDLFFAVMAPNRGGARLYGCMGWARVEAMVNNATSGGLEVVFSAVRTVMTPEGKPRVSHLRCATSTEVTVMHEGGDLAKIREALGWRRLEDEDRPGDKDKGDTQSGGRGGAKAPTSWLMRGRSRDVEAHLLNRRWPLAKYELVQVIRLMRPGDDLFFAVAGRNRGGARLDGCVGWARVDSLVRSATSGGLEVAFSGVRILVAVEGNARICHVRPAAPMDVTVLSGGRELDRIEKALGWRRLEDEDRSDPLSGEIPGTVVIRGFDKGTLDAQTIAGPSDFLVDDQ